MTVCAAGEAPEAAGSPFEGPDVCRAPVDERVRADGRLFDSSGGQ